MYSIKKKAIRSALCCLSQDELETLSYQADTEVLEELANFIIDNSAFATSNLIDKVKNKFANYVDEHSLILLPNIMNVVNECKRNFIAENWDVLLADLFPNTQMFDNVVYMVTTETETSKTEKTIDTQLYSTYQKAKNGFNSQKAVICNMDEWENVEVDDDSQYQVQNNYWEEYADVWITKSVIF